MFSCEFCQISKNTFSYRTPLVAASASCFWEGFSIKLSVFTMFGDTVEVFLFYCHIFGPPNRIDDIGKWNKAALNLKGK